MEEEEEEEEEVKSILDIHLILEKNLISGNENIEFEPSIFMRPLILLHLVETQADRQTDRQTNKQTDRQTETDRQRDSRQMKENGLHSSYMHISASSNHKARCKTLAPIQVSIFSIHTHNTHCIEPSTVQKGKENVC